MSGSAPKEGYRHGLVIVVASTKDPGLGVGSVDGLGLVVEYDDCGVFVR